MWDVLLASGIDPATDGWTSLLDARALSADGYTIAGTGVRNDTVEAFVAVIPEPASLSVLALGAASLLRPRRRA